LKSISPNEANLLKENNKKINKELEENIKVLKNERNYGHIKDFDISKKLVAYITDIFLSQSITSLSESLNEILKKKMYITKKMQDLAQEIKILGIIDKKSSFNQKDIAELQERISIVKKK
jgi:hypothetical protein